MKNNINPVEVLQKIMPIVEKAAADNGLIALETDFVKDAGVWTLRVFLYKESGAITHDDCQAVTKAVDEPLDKLVTVPYRLEVSSPGIDRKLKSEKEYNIFRGKRVKIKLKNHPERGYEPFLAILAGYNEAEGSLTIEPLDTEGTLTVKKELISLIKLEPEF